MKTLNNFITEALIKKDTKIRIYKYFPKDKKELRKIIEQLLKERGEDADLNDIDVSNIEDFCYVSPRDDWGLFYKLDIGNINISGWDMSNATDISYMFYDCGHFNCDISSWNVKNVTRMNWVFTNCYKFDCDLSKWNLAKKPITTSTFHGCTKLENKNLIPDWYKI